MSISLIAVFIPILMMPGIIGRLSGSSPIVLSVIDCRIFGDFSDGDAR